ncbi:MAG: glycosyltransferase family 25 protein [Candidatus Diapherotrites archaeon]|jgi:hypothetical protein|uniref:Glycosyltransferase family 25 protein n=1 Tax=Candidatus Iainarchaeum sp. TaxID=3101447 RepID=A0A8T5GEV2_9ARCH|nr:glycosyltransferase family 25 protein [Candidatus Diapherotrites archaeon]MBT7241652.1 glycosyltransferase family 25 protein [Candidatus Diapherotrites archaeon]
MAKNKETKEEEKPYVIFTISGGIGKNIMATAVIKSIKKKYNNHNLVIITAWPDVFLNNPNVYRVFRFGNTPYFMEDYIKDDTIIFQIDPYHHDSFIHKKKHLIEAWCDTYNLECVSKEPEIFLTPREKQFVKNKFNRNKPLFVIQTNGGVGGPNQLKYSWSRDIPLNQAQTVVDEMNKTHHVMHIRKPDQLALNNCEPVSVSLRELFGLIAISDKRLFNESFGYHCAAAFKLPSTVCFVGTKPEVYSYESNTNIIPQDEKIFIHTVDKFMEDSPWAGEKLYECPYEVEKLFSITSIVEAIKKQPENKEAPKPTQAVMERENLANMQSSDSLRSQNIGVAGLQATNPIQSTVSPDGSPSNTIGNFVDNYFDKIYVINMDKRKDRWEQVQEQLASSNITKFERMSGVALTDKELAKIPKEEYENFNGLKVIKKEDKDLKETYIKGAIGCRRSHLNCIKDAKEKGYYKILILEDDVIINPQINENLFQVMQQIGDGWQLLYLGGDYWENNSIYQTSSYALDGIVFDKIIDEMEKSGSETDFFYVEKIQKNVVMRKVVPPLIIQRKEDSDIPTQKTKKKTLQA